MLSVNLVICFKEKKKSNSSSLMIEKGCLVPAICIYLVVLI